ncbi:DUF4145 domain-containing protein [Phocaeicola paurosaccharolyticus]|uniref:DUF4145 domain-containing protein n=1 Tax=Phocaeicola paurosaccharolyticus TaxID=732242 RepID=UPI0004696D19|nr:DUF4145 domain-containing protein [Phocaeicola paurosaccharolyticus]
MKCPHCQVEVNESFREVYLGDYEDNMKYSIFFMKCPNTDCNKIIIKMGISEYLINVGVNRLSGENIIYKQIYPLSSGHTPAAPEVEKSLAEDYNEACLVLPLSTKASAALSRRCLQNIIRTKAEIKKKNLKMEIDALIDANMIPSYLSDNLNIIRGYGNIAAHGIEDQASGEILDVEPTEAEFLLDIIELLFDFYFVQPAKSATIKEELNKKLISAGQKPVS